ncbi:MAG: type II secretion system protein GspE, partial [Brevundimonas sp.]|nr:type II secretion system protein GspE [Brevundimonas sp.]
MITLVNPTLPYAFAKRHGVVLLDAGETALVGVRDGADPLALVEARRALGRPLRIERLTASGFDRRL